MKPKESFDGQNVSEAIQASTMAPSQITLQLGGWLQVKTDLTDLDNNGTITYTISTLGFVLSGDTVGSTNASDPKLQLGADVYLFKNLVGSVSFSITSDLSNQQSTAVVTATFRGTGPQYSGIIACWGK